MRKSRKRDSRKPLSSLERVVTWLSEREPHIKCSDLVNLSTVIMAAEIFDVDVEVIAGLVAQEQMHRESERATLSYIAAYIDRKHRAPTLDEIARGMDMASPASAFRLVQSLEEHGSIQRVGGHRSIRLLADAPPIQYNLPLRDQRVVVG